jgi:hypothetical protein
MLLRRLLAFVEWLFNQNPFVLYSRKIGVQLRGLEVMLCLNAVMPALGAGIHAFAAAPKAWIPGPSPGMTNELAAT